MGAATYGEALRLVRKRLGVKQKELIARSAISRSHVSAIENNHIIMPEDETQERLARALGVDPAEILAEMNLVREDRPEYQFGMDSDEHDLREAMRELPHEDRRLILRFVELLVERNRERYE